MIEWVGPSEAMVISFSCLNCGLCLPLGPYFGALNEAKCVFGL